MTFLACCVSLTRNFTVIAFTGWLYCIENFFTFPWKTEFALKFSTVLNIFFAVQDIWATCDCPVKQSLPWNFSLYCVYFYFQELWATCTCPEKQSVPWIHCIECIFLSFRIFEQLTLALKTEFVLKSLYWMYIFIIQDFWATCACPEKQSCPEIFNCIEIYVIIQDFWATWACPENKVFLEFTVLNIYFLSFRIFEQLTLVLKKRVALKFFTVLNIFFSFRIFEQLELALKTESALKFFKTGEQPPPPRTPASYAYAQEQKLSTLKIISQSA